MRTPRILGRRETNYYHIMSRVVNRDHIFGKAEKAFFIHTMRRLESFMGLRTLTYCVMNNHWHILIEVPSSRDLADKELLKRIEAFYPKPRAKMIFQEYERAKQYSEESGGQKLLEEWRMRHLSRIGDLSSFVKELKERFSKWYNRKHNRRGTLWEERFKSVLVENSTHTIATMAAYIDLNPVRAGLVDDPIDYPHCGYAAATAGDEKSRMGIEQILSLHGQRADWRTLAAQYRIHLFSAGERTGFDPGAVQQVLDQRGELTPYELRRCHIRYFNDGVVVGSKPFIEEMFEQNRSLFGEKRKTGARKISGADRLFCMRNLQLNAIRAPSR